MFDSRFWRINVERKGREAEPVVTIDQFAADPEALVNAAAGARFSAEAAHYPGIRADVGVAMSQAMLAALRPVFADVFAMPTAPSMLGCFFSIVTTPAATLTPLQRLPHYDGVEAERLALILYLCAPEHGGTSFYRHKATEFETVSQERFAAYRAALAADVQTHGLPPPGYINGDTPLFERIGGSPATFNRAVLYRGRNLHSGDIAPDFRFDPSPRNGRLTLNAFLLGRPA